VCICWSKELIFIEMHGTATTKINNKKRGGEVCVVAAGFEGVQRNLRK
jgi:hypothetical protein